jgi:hypothetical protein
MSLNTYRCAYKGPVTSCAYYNKDTFLIGRHPFFSELETLGFSSIYLNILKGCGPYLSLVDSKSFDLLVQAETLACCVIHGIFVQPNTSLICVYGQKAFNLCVYNEKTNSFEFKTEKHIELADWIWTMAWLNSHEAGKLGIVCAHSQFFIYDMPTHVIESRVTCAEMTMLYSAKIFKIEQTTFIASGTIYNDVLIWNATDGSIQCRINAHDGVIFNIGFDESLSILYSVSDDRYDVTIDRKLKTKICLLCFFIVHF